MDSPEKTFSELVSIIKSWNPWKPGPDNVSKVFWMPDQSCRVCYQCDSQFNLINRRHHCRLCGRIFCAKCTTNSVPAPSSCQRNPWEEQEKVRACNYCFEQWEQGTVACEKEIQVFNQDHSASLSTSSSISINSFGTANNSTNTFCSIPYSIDPCQQSQQGSDLSLHQSSMTVEGIDKEGVSTLRRCSDREADLGNASHEQYGFSMLRTDDEEEEEYRVYKPDSKVRHCPHLNGYNDQVILNGTSNMDGSQDLHSGGDSCSNPTHQSFDGQALEEYPSIGKHEDGHDIGDESEAPSSFYVSEDVDVEPVDFENNGILWLPPEPETEEDDQEAGLFDDDDDGDVNAAGEWGYLRSSSSFGSGESRHRDRLSEEHKKALKNVVGGHFRALISQLLQVENLPVEDNHKNSWLEIVTSLSWEAASLLKPDMSKSGGMDPGGYVKVKCIANGSPCESVVVKGVVCKKNVAHRRMTSKVYNPRLLILGGALEYQRVTNLLSSVDTLLQQEMDHLKMAVAKIAVHDPDVLLVEKSVSRYAQEYLLENNISLVLNVKRPLLDRIARCSGAQIAPSIDHLSSPKLGYCEKFHVEKFLEDHGSASQDRKKTVKTLMFFEGCPKPLGCTILLRGSDKDELKKVKHVIQYGFFAAYHLALETSFLADEGASLPELPLKSPITVALPHSPPSVDGSISTVLGLTIPGNEKSQEPEPNTELQRAPRSTVADLASLVFRTEPFLACDPSLSGELGSSVSHSIASYSSATFSGNTIPDCYDKTLHPCKERNEVDHKISLGPETSVMSNSFSAMNDHTNEDGCMILEKLNNGIVTDTPQNGHSEVCKSQLSDSELLSPEDVRNHSKGQEFVNEDPLSLKEEFSTSLSDHQSILVSVSSRCVWKGTVCEKSHLFRIKYYGNFDKPLGRFLRDHLFDQSYRCSSCEMPSEAHVQCYTHRQGTLTIAVKKLSEILLPGERDGKIWMWHRCLRCPRVNGYPPATQRIVMSDAAWGLSFGKFLELSFSNHAAASRVASCGHSLHRDSLRFYGFGNMVACFRYASIDLHSVYLPPHELVFDSGIQEWIQKETDEVINRAELLFSEVLNAVSQIGEKRSSSVPLSSSLKTSEYRRQVAELEGMLQKEKAEFEEELQKILNHERGKDQPGIDILEIYRLRRQLLFQSFVWDRRLDHTAKLVNTSKQSGMRSSVSDDKERHITENQTIDALVPERGYNDYDSILVGSKPNDNPDLRRGVDNDISQSDAFHEELDAAKSSNYEKEGQPYRSISDSINAQSDHSDLGLGVLRTHSDGQLLNMPSLSDTLDAKWTGENHLGSVLPKDITSVTADTTAADSLITSRKREASSLEDHAEDQNESKNLYSASKSLDDVEDSLSWLAIPFLNLYPSFDKNFLGSTQKFDTLDDHPVYVSSSFWKLELQRGARLLLPIGVNDTVIPVYDDEPTSIISYALMSRDYHVQLIDDEKRPKDGGDSKASSYFSDLSNFQAFHCADDSTFQFLKGLALTDDMKTSMSGSRNASTFDPLLCTKSMHIKVSFGEDGPLGKVKHTVTCYYAKWFEALRRVCCSSELEYIRSLSRCKKWGAQGGKSNVFFAKTLDDRFIIKQVTKTELESFIKFAPEYFKYLSESIHSGSPTCLAKILGIYQVKSKHPKGGKESRMDVLVMENLLFRRNVTRLYDLKGSARSRYNPDSSGSNNVLLDQNLIEAMPTSPIFVSNKGKRLLERAVWNDTAFLASIDVMDYSLLLGVDDEKHELILGIIDFMRQYTWDKHLETWAKASGILGGSRNSSPTVISPDQYKKRFRKAMATYFLMLPDQWPPARNKSQSDVYEENTQPKNSPR
ncbi:1-phosphatidylinositol-3-phosphate 5-kinase FAB1B-like [Prosopis cineraria]|uniref:1-phosphatidylinositol-3-phosphate 5-kinase FAB1B-like n=1 Tax=Prosopis cineraria TaxID=364024 RepID=UPI00241051BD|nr:1-phosphatidylinositol-3-phosphate 5-kinase FAB1B-like [Prosopis cineraria]